jgi:hypothetical protein
MKIGSPRSAKCEKGRSESVIGLNLVRQGQSLGESWTVLTSAKCEEGRNFVWMRVRKTEIAFSLPCKISANCEGSRDSSSLTSYCAVSMMHHENTATILLVSQFATAEQVG